MHRRVVEEVALDAPHVVEDLPPLGARVDDARHLLGAQRLLHLLTGRGVDDRKPACRGDQDFRAIGGEGEVADACDDVFCFTFLDVPQLEGRLGAFADAGPWRFDIQQLALDRSQAAVVPGLRRQQNHAALEAFEVDFHRFYGLFVVLAFVFVIAVLVVLVVVLLRAVIVFALFVLVFGLLVVRAGGQRRGDVLTQRYGCQVGRIGIDPRAVEVRVRG